jgi:penicillin amidase
MHIDRVSMMARDLAPVMARITPTDERARRAVQLIAGWNGDMDRSRPEPLIFTAWLRELNRLLYADELGEAFESFWRLRPVFVRRALTERTAWCDVTTTEPIETCDEILERALIQALEDLAGRYGDDPAEWRWGEAHRARFPHPVLGRVPVVRDLIDITIESDGGAFTVNRAQHWVSDERGPFTSRHGPVYRAIYDLARLDDSRFIQPTGQSGNPLSPHFGDFVERWRDGEYIRIPSDRAAALEGAIGVLILRPTP